MPELITNKYGLPDALAKACMHDTHRVGGDISVSQLIDAPRVRILKKLNRYESDVSERLYALMGTALHHILERANISEVRRRAFIMTAETIIMEAERVTDETKKKQLIAAAKYIEALIPVFFKELDKRYIFEITLRVDIKGVVLYGTFDIFDTTTGILYDYKFCSVYAYIFPESKDSWRYQTNVYAFLLMKEGYDVKEIRVVAFFRDWQEMGIMRNKDYPKAQILEIPVKLHTMEEIATYIDARIKKHLDAENGELPLCTGKERWAKADQWAVKTPSSKKALRVVDIESLADAFMLENKFKLKGAFKEFRPGESVRCAKFCPVADFCDQRKLELKERKMIADAE